MTLVVVYSATWSSISSVWLSHRQGCVLSLSVGGTTRCCHLARLIFRQVGWGYDPEKRHRRRSFHQKLWGVGFIAPGQFAVTIYRVVAEVESLNSTANVPVLFVFQGIMQLHDLDIVGWLVTDRVAGSSDIQWLFIKGYTKDTVYCERRAREKLQIY